MSLDLSPDPIHSQTEFSVVKANKKPELVNEQKLPEELIKILKSTKHLSGNIDDFKGAAFETKRGDKWNFHIKPKPQKDQSYIVTITGNNSAARAKSKHNRGGNYKEIQVVNYTISQKEHSELLTILKTKMGQSQNSTDKLHGKKKK